MTQEIATQPMHAETLSKVLLDGNLAQLNPAQKVEYMTRVCESLGLNPLTKPFEFISLNGKLVMYAKRDCTEQLRKIHGVSISIVSREVVEGIYVVTARAQDRTGRQDESIGAVLIQGLQGENKANALMKAETKAKRRVTLSVCGLGMLDETEAEPLAYSPPPVRESASRIAGTHGEATKAESPKGVSSIASAPSAPTSGPAPADLDADWREAPMAWKPGRAGTAAAVAPTGGPITPDQIKAIHTLKAKVGGLTDEAYRKGVAVYRQMDGSCCVDAEGKGTSKLLSKDQASHLIQRFEDKIAKQAERAGTGVDLDAGVPAKSERPLSELLSSAFEGDAAEETSWLQSLWAVDHIKELDTKESTTALQLLIAFSQGPDVYDSALTRAREQGLVR